MQKLAKTLVAIALSSSIGCSIPKEKRFINKISTTALTCQIQGEKSEKCKAAIKDLRLFDEKEIPEIDMYSSPPSKIRSYFFERDYFYLNENGHILLGEITEKRTVTMHHAGTPHTFDAYLFTTLATSNRTMLNYIGVWREERAFFNISAIQYDYQILRKDAEHGDWAAKKAFEEVMMNLRVKWDLRKATSSLPFSLQKFRL